MSVRRNQFILLPFEKMWVITRGDTGVDLHLPFSRLLSDYLLFLLYATKESGH